MTKSDVVDAFIRGDLDRRGFIKKLTAVGVSSTAAIAYAGSLVQSAAAGPSRNGSGFITRLQDADAEYGPAVPIEDVPAAIAAILAEVEAIAAELSSLLEDFDDAAFEAAGLEASDRELLEKMLSQIQEQIDAINALEGIPAATGASTPESTPSGDLMERLAAFADDLNEVVGEYAALIPAIEDIEEQELFVQIALVAARHAAIASYLAGEDPFPSAFEEPIDPAQ